MIILFQKCDTFDMTAKRKSLAGGCDFPGSPRLHTIDLEFINQNTFCRLTKTELSKEIKQLLSAGTYIC